jgi:hypothetical protein
MHLFPKPRVDNCHVLARVGFSFVDRFTAKNAVIEQAIQVALIDERALLVSATITTQFTG